jgi:hypothetical protein
MPARPLPSAPATEDTALDRLFGWFSGPTAPTPAALPVDPGRYPGPRIGN